MESKNSIQITYSVQNNDAQRNNEYKYDFNIIKTDKTIPLGDVQIPIYNSVENPLFHVYHVLVDGLKYTRAEGHQSYKEYDKQQKQCKNGLYIGETGELLMFDIKKVFPDLGKTFKAFPLILKGQQQALKSLVFLTEKGLLHYIRKSNMPEAEKISRDIENLVIDIRKGHLQISIGNINAQTVNNIHNNKLSITTSYILQEQPALQQINSFEDFQSNIQNLSPNIQITKIEERIQQIEDLIEINPLLITQFKQLYNLKEQLTKNINDQLLEDAQQQTKLAQQELLRIQQTELQLKQEQEQLKKQLEETLKKIKKVHGDVYKLRIKQSVLTKISPSFKSFVEQLIKYLTYIGMADRKHKEPFILRMQEHIKEFKECESQDVNKSLIFCAAKLLINQMLIDGQQPLEYEDIIESVRLNTEMIKDENILRQCEAQYIQRENPLLNSIKYKNYLTEDQKQMSKLDKEITKLQNNLQREELYNKALEIREIELQNETDFTIQYIQQNYDQDITEDYMNIVRSKNKKIETIQNNRKRSHDINEQIRNRIQTTSQQRSQIQQIKQQKDDDMQRIMISEQSEFQPQSAAISKYQRSKTTEKQQDSAPILLQNQNNKKDQITDQQNYCNDCYRQFVQINRHKCKNQRQ